ncbi:MAG: hypothetical protein IKE35_04745, partial [Lachnospiraceae bacterium]|nr:hypothetical protein [Lachnospiraceae bacterium]
MKIGMHFGQMIFMIIVMIVVWLLAREYMADQAVSFFNRTRRIDLFPLSGRIDTFGQFIDALRTLRYQVVSSAGKVIVSEAIFAPVAVITLFCTGVFALRFFGDLISYSGEMRRIKKMFAPLDEMAASVEALSRMELSEDKYHLIEEKITSL